MLIDVFVVIFVTSILVGFSGAHETSGPADDLPIGTVVSTIDEVDTKEKGDEEGNVSLQLIQQPYQ